MTIIKRINLTIEAESKVTQILELAGKAHGGGLASASCLTLATSWTVAHQTPLFMGLLRQEYWSGLPFSSPGDLPDPGIKPMSPTLAGGFFTTEPPHSELLGHGICTRSALAGTVKLSSCLSQFTALQVVYEYSPLLYSFQQFLTVIGLNFMVSGCMHAY